MVRLIIIISMLLGSNSLFAQSLIDVYKKGNIKLVPDKEYAQGNDWEKVFVNYYDTLYKKPMGERKSIVLLPDGSAVVNHAYQNYYSRFDANGKFVNEFEINTGSGKRLGKRTEAIQGVINNTLFTGVDNLGNMVCCDFSGKYIKTLKLNYMVRDMIPLSDNKFAVVGWVIWKTKFRDFVSIVDYNTNEEKIIWDHFTDRNEGITVEYASREELMEKRMAQRKIFNYFYWIEGERAMSFSTMSFSNASGISSPPKITFVKNQLIIAIPKTGEILTYTIDGKQVSKEKIEWSSYEISPDMQREIQKNAIEKFEKKQRVFGSVSKEEDDKAKEAILKQMNDDLSKIKDPIPIPAFSTIIKDSDDNILFFEIPVKDGANKFNVWVYDKGGKFVVQSSFECDEYNLSITPQKMVFHNGYIYSLQTLKEATGNPLRLVRFKLTN